MTVVTHELIKTINQSSPTCTRLTNVFYNITTFLLSSVISISIHNSNYIDSFTFVDELLLTKYIMFLHQIN